MLNDPTSRQSRSVYWNMSDMVVRKDGETKEFRIVPIPDGKCGNSEARERSIAPDNSKRSE